MSMNSDIVKGVVGTSTNADGSSYKTFGDIKLYGGNVYKVANDVTTPAVVGRFCYVRLVSSVLTATKPYYDTSATVDPIDDSRAFLYCNGFVLEADSVTGELYVAVSGVVESGTLVGSSSDLNVNAESTYFLDWGTEGAGALDTLQSGVSGVISTFLDGDATATADDYPILEASIRPVAVGTGTGMVKLSFEPGKSSGLFSDSLTLHYNDTSRAVLSAVPLVGTEISSNRNVDVIINDSDDIVSGEYFRVRSGSNPVEVFKITGDGDIEVTGLVACSPTAGSGVESGIRSAYYGGSLGIPDLAIFATESSGGHFNVNTSDTGTFNLKGPSGAGGKLKVSADSIELNPSATEGLLFSNIPAIALTGVAYDAHLLAVDPVTNKVYRDTVPSNDRHLFTGTHAYKTQEDLPIGSSVALTGGSLALTTSTSQTNCVGIIQQGMQASEDAPITISTGEVVTSGNVYYVAAVGDSIKGDLQGFKVCNEGGAISAGDLLVTSSTAGRLMKQADDIIRSSTVGKAMQDVTFNDSGEADDIYGFIYCG